MNAEQQILIEKKKLAPGYSHTLTHSEKAIAAVLNRIIARQNVIASQSMMDEA